MNDEELFKMYLKDCGDEDYYNELNDIQKLEYKHSISKTFSFAWYRASYYTKDLLTEFKKCFERVIK